MGPDEYSSKGIFNTPGGGRNFRRRRRGIDTLSRFAELLSEHVDEDDVEAGKVLATGRPLGPDPKPDPGGNPRVAAVRMGLKPDSGNGMLQRIRQRLGPQAR